MGRPGQFCGGVGREGWGVRGFRQSQLWKSIFRHPAPLDRRNRIAVVLANLVLHVHPVAVRKLALRPAYTWFMGPICFFLFLVETVTGVLLMFYYRPTVQWAYHDILDLRDVVSLGVLRGCTAGRRCHGDRRLAAHVSRVSYRQL